MEKMMESKYGGRPCSFVVGKIISIIASDSKEDETYISIEGEEEPFYVSEPYEVIKKKLEACLQEEGLAQVKLLRQALTDEREVIIKLTMAKDKLIKVNDDQAELIKSQSEKLFPVAVLAEKYEVRDNGIFLRGYNVRIATFSENTTSAQEMFSGILRRPVDG